MLPKYRVMRDNLQGSLDGSFGMSVVSISMQYQGLGSFRWKEIRAETTP